MENKIVLTIGHPMEDEVDMLLTLVKALEALGVRVYEATSEEVAPEFEEVDDGIQNAARD